MAMTIDITPGLIATAVGWASSSLMAAWILSRRSKQWDEVEDVVTALFGDRKSKEKGLILKFEELEKEHQELKQEYGVTRSLLNGALRAMHANFSTEKEVETAVKFALEQILRAKCVAPCPAVAKTSVPLHPSFAPLLTPMPMRSPLMPPDGDDEGGSGGDGDL